MTKPIDSYLILKWTIDKFHFFKIRNTTCITTYLLLVILKSQYKHCAVNCLLVDCKKHNYNAYIVMIYAIQILNFMVKHLWSFQFTFLVLYWPNLEATLHQEFIMLQILSLIFLVILYSLVMLPNNVNFL